MAAPTEGLGGKPEDAGIADGAPGAETAKPALVDPPPAIAVNPGAPLELGIGGSPLGAIPLG